MIFPIKVARPGRFELPTLCLEGSTAPSRGKRHRHLGHAADLSICAVLSCRTMNAKAITPILNVSDISASFAWFGKWGWRKCWDWGTPPTFGAVGSGECETFLCQGGQGSRGRGANASTFGADGDETADKGVWMSVWVGDVDEVYRECVGAGLDVTFPPTNMPWRVREMHVRHPDGHVFRVSKGIGGVE